MMLDYSDFFGRFDKWQKQLDDAGIDFDVRTLCGATHKEIEGYVNMRLANKAREEAVVSQESKNGSKTA